MEQVDTVWCSVGTLIGVAFMLVVFRQGMIVVSGLAITTPVNRATIDTVRSIMNE